MKHQNVLLVIDSISTLSYEKKGLINGYEKEIRDLKSLLKLSSVLRAADMKINYSFISCLELQ